MSPRPSWLDPALYPFRPHHLDLGGERLHYLDEGQGPPLVFVHGNPTWSFTWRHLVAGLRDRHRCVAPDHLGFGLSDKPARGLRPADHARNLGALLDHLGIEDATLVVEDWGGPIGLSWALDHPERVRRLVVLNSWCWSVAGDPHFERFSRFMGGPIGRWLIRHLNLFARAVLPKAVGRPLPRAVRRHYTAALPDAGARRACAIHWSDATASSPERPGPASGCSGACRCRC